MTPRERYRLKKVRLEAAIERGKQDYLMGKRDINPYSKSDLLEYCAWSAGYFDAQKGYIS